MSVYFLFARSLFLPPSNHFQFMEDILMPDVISLFNSVNCDSYVQLSFSVAFNMITATNNKPYYELFFYIN